MMEYALLGRKQRNSSEHVGIFGEIIVVGMLDAHRNVARHGRALHRLSTIRCQVGISEQVHHAIGFEVRAHR